MNDAPPPGWIVKTLGELAEVRHGFAFSSNDFGDHGPIVLTPGNFTAGGDLDFGTKRVVRHTGAFGEEWVLKRGDLLVVMTDLSQKKLILGSPVILNTKEPVLHNQRIGLVVPRSAVVDRQFLRLAMLRPEYRERIKATATGTLIAHTSPGRLMGETVPLPPLNEQRRIVAKLEALQSRSRRAREALDAVPALLEKLRQSILAAAFRGDLTKDWRAQNPNPEPASALLARIRTERRQKWEASELAKLQAKGKPPTNDAWKAKYKEPEPVDATGLPELPEGWCWASVEELSGLITSGSRGWAEYYADSGAIFVRSQDINSDVLRSDDVAHVRLPSDPEGGRTRLQQSDVLITITGANVTRCAWVTRDLGEAYVSQHVALIRPVADDISPFLHLWLICESGGRKQLKQVAYGSGKPGLNLNDVGVVVVPVPPVSERAEIASVVAAISDRIATTSLTADALVRVVTQLDRATLAKAFRGELVPQDPNDEPAEVMLARLNGKANGDGEAAAGGKAAKGRRGRGKAKDDADAAADEG